MDPDGVFFGKKNDTLDFLFNTAYGTRPTGQLPGSPETSHKAGPEPDQDPARDKRL